MERAKIYVLDENGKKMENKTIEVMFNPKEYAHSLNVEWEGEDIPEFKISKFGTLTITLFFDSYEKGVDVREDHEIKSSGKVRTIAGTKRIIELWIP